MRGVNRLKLQHRLIEIKIIKDGHWLLRNSDPNKRPSIKIAGIRFTATRWAAIAFLGLEELTNQTEICHKCDCIGCFNPEHLYIGTHSSNKKDWWDAQDKKGLCVKGHEKVDGKCPTCISISKTRRQEKIRNLFREILCH